LGIDSLFAHIVLAGLFQAVVSFVIGFSAGLLYRVVRQLS
jgi:hypothetical protein